MTLLYIIIAVMFLGLVIEWRFQRILNGATFRFVGPSRVKLLILYKSGHSHECWFRSFEDNGSQFKWTHDQLSHRPITLGGPEIESVFQIATEISFWRYLPWVAEDY